MIQAYALLQQIVAAAIVNCQNVFVLKEKRLNFCSKAGQTSLTFGICRRSASSRWIEIFGLARSTSNRVSILDAVDSESFALSRLTLSRSPPERNSELPILRTTCGKNLPLTIRAVSVLFSALPLIELPQMSLNYAMRFRFYFCASFSPYFSLVSIIVHNVVHNFSPRWKSLADLICPRH